MIFVTVGSQMPFDRLVSAMDDWSRSNQDEHVICQTGETDLMPTAMTVIERMSPEEFESHVKTADLVVSHAGMGTILTCLLLGTPVVVFPRLGSLHETRNDHQVATCDRLRDRPGVRVASDASELLEALDTRQVWSQCAASIGPHASPELLGRIRVAIEDTRKLAIRDRLRPRDDRQIHRENDLAFARCC